MGKLETQSNAIATAYSPNSLHTDKYQKEPLKHQIYPLPISLITVCCAHSFSYLQPFIYLPLNHSDCDNQLRSSIKLRR